MARSREAWARGGMVEGPMATACCKTINRLSPNIPCGVLMGSLRVRRPYHHHARSAPQCGVSHAPHASWVRVPIEINTGTVRKVFSGMGQVLSRQSANRVRHLSGRSTTCLSVRRTGQIMNGCCCSATSTFSFATRTADNIAPFHPPNSSACRIINMLGSANGAALNN